MTATVLWLYGVLVTASLVMLLAWSRAARDLAAEFDEPWHALRWCRAFVIAVGLTVHASFMAAACGYRAFDVLAHQRVELGSEASLQIMLLVGLAASKVSFVWAGSIDERHHHVRWPWWAFLYAMVVWALACWTWAVVTPA